MRENKAFASLSSGLLARKGQARPAMRPQGFGLGQGHPEDLGWNDMGHDMPRPAGVRLPASLSSPQSSAAVHTEVPSVVLQQEEIIREFASRPSIAEDIAEPALVESSAAEIASEPAVQPVKVPARRTAPGPKRVAPKAIEPQAGARKTAFTLRLDTERHLRLRLACAVQNRSAQQLVTEALDRLLEDLPDVARLAGDLGPQG